MEPAGFSPSGPAGHLPRQREAVPTARQELIRPPLTRGLSAKLTGGETQRGERTHEAIQSGQHPPCQGAAQAHDAVGVKLWYDYLRQYPVRFQRQKAIGNYIADFYCAKARLVVELDGGGHYTAEQAEQDRIRTRALERMDLKVLRICNLDIQQNFQGVCAYLDRTVQESLS